MSCTWSSEPQCLILGLLFGLKKPLQDTMNILLLFGNPKTNQLETLLYPFLPILSAWKHSLQKWFAQSPELHCLLLGLLFGSEEHAGLQEPATIPWKSESIPSTTSLKYCSTNHLPVVSVWGTAKQSYVLRPLPKKSCSYQDHTANNRENQMPKWQFKNTINKTQGTIAPEFIYLATINPGYYNETEAQKSDYNPIL